MVKSKKTLLLVVLALVAVLSVAVLTACNGGEKYKITWDVSENATVTVEGESTLPTEVEAEKTLVFSVTASKGYTVSQVLVNDRAISALKGGNYSTSIKADTVIKVETTENVESVAVKTNPDKLTYVAGEKLDATGMEVEVTYGSGRKATETNYTVVYQNGADAFSLGDTTFAVSFKGVKSSDVSLSAAVEAKIVIDPQGGTIAEDYFTALQSNTELHNLTKSEDGVISFTYSTLSAAIALPTAEQWSKGQVGDYSFVGWGATEIAVDNKASKTFTVQYKAGLLIVESLRYENQTVTENGEQVEVPYLIIAGKFNAAKEAWLYLYEGNDKVELIGDTIGGADVQRGDPFELKFDLRKLVATGFIGKWMDIKFCAKEGSGEDARLETMEIDLNDYPENFVDVSQILINGDYAYNFQVWEAGEGRYLKAIYTKYFKNEYTMRGGLDSEGKMILTIEGAVSKTWAGKAVCIDIECDGTYYKGYSAITADGNYTINLNLDEIPLNKDGYFHFTIVESETDHTELYKDSPNNLLNSGCINKDLQTVQIGLIENMGAIRVANSDDKRVFYIGKGKWGGIVLYGCNEALTTTNATLAVVNEKPYLVISGTYGAIYNDTINDVLATVVADLQSNANAGSVSGWDTVELTADNMLKEAANGVWKVSLDISAYNPEAGDVLFSHFGFGTKADFKLDNFDTQTTIVVGGLKYSLSAFTDWGGKLVCVNVKEAVAEDPNVFVAAGWGRYITEDKFNKYVAGFKAYCDENKIAYTSISGTYYPDAEYNKIAAFTAKIVSDGNVDAIVACGANIDTSGDSAVKDSVVTKIDIEVKDQTGRKLATLNSDALSQAFLTYAATEAAIAILAE